MTNDALAVANLLERIGRLIRTEEQVGGLYPVQWTTLRYLARANRFSRTPMSITHYLGSTRGTVSQTIIALERKALVIRTPSEQDKRSVNVSLTPEGQQLLENDPIQKLADEIKIAIGSQTNAMQDMLEKLLGQLIVANQGRAFGLCKTCRHFVNQGGQSVDKQHHCSLLSVDLSDGDSKKICTEHTA